ncbi:MAG: YceD family protein [Balneolaceae bacterium]
MTFKIQELPSGLSRRTVHLPEEYFELTEQVRLLEADCHIDFLNGDRFIKVSYKVDANVELVCDRSLKPFTSTIKSSFDILFEPDTSEKSETKDSAVRPIPPDPFVLDINDEVKDSIQLAVPIKKIHPDYLKDDGTYQAFQVKTFGASDEEDEQTIDPRWEKLKQLKK